MTTIRQRTAALKIMKTEAQTSINRIANSDRNLAMKFGRVVTITPTEILENLKAGKFLVRKELDNTQSGAIHQYLDLDDLRNQKIEENWTGEIPNPILNGSHQGQDMHFPRLGISYIRLRFPSNIALANSIEDEYLRVQNLVEFGDKLDLPKELRDFSLFLSRLS